MKKQWVIWTGILLLLGMTGLAAVLLDIRQQDRTTALYKAQYGYGAEEYVHQYLKWSKLTPAECIENPWGYGDYGGPQIRQKLITEQPGRLRADIADLANATTVPVVLADTMYGPHWRQAVERYRKRNDIRDGLAGASTISILAGVIVIVGYSLNCGFRHLLAANSRRRERCTQESGEYKSYPPDDDNDEPCNDVVSNIISSEKPEMTEPSRISDDAPSIGVGNDNIGCFSNFGLAQGGVKAIELRETLRSRASSLSDNNNSPQPATQTDVLSTLMSTAPVTHELNELTLEVSAIREYAASQQDRVRRLQDGYDWSIIKRFCIRIIRCIDNMDERIAHLAEEGGDPQSLEDVRDELVFSLESSGVEQFEPEINACYKGLEKTVEAVKTREPTDDPDLVGKIAKVIKPGYEYVVSDEEVRVVRCSQVQLYGPDAQTCEEQQNE
jgi:molecular chaperone GrpE (heat shock protein)